MEWTQDFPGYGHYWLRGYGWPNEPQLVAIEDIQNLSDDGVNPEDPDEPIVFYLDSDCVVITPGKPNKVWWCKVPDPPEFPGE